MSDRTYIDLLEEEFLTRHRTNSLYSKRAFAKSLNLSHAYISLIFQKKRNLSVGTATRIAKKLKWNKVKCKYFVTLVEFENPRSIETKTEALDELDQLERSNPTLVSLDVDTFATMSTWYYSAILVLLTIKNTKSTTATIAKKLNLELSEAEFAIRRLNRLGLVKVYNGVVSTNHNDLRVKSVPSAVIRDYHKKMLKMASDAQDNLPYDRRVFSNLTLSVDPNQIELAWKKIKDFQCEMAALLDGKKPTEVFQLSIQLFQLSALTQCQNQRVMNTGIRGEHI